VRARFADALNYLMNALSKNCPRGGTVNEPESIKKTVIPIERGKELKNRRPTPRTIEPDNDRSAIRRLAQCLQLAAELIREVSPKP
jgi:hypothetical protein